MFNKIEMTECRRDILICILKLFDYPNVCDSYGNINSCYVISELSSKYPEKVIKDNLKKLCDNEYLDAVRSTTNKKYVFIKDFKPVSISYLIYIGQLS